MPVLAGSAAYALSGAMGWNWGLERKATEARGFNGVIAISVLLGLVIQYSPTSPMKALFWSAVINGIVAVPLMVVIISSSDRPKPRDRMMRGNVTRRGRSSWRLKFDLGPVGLPGKRQTRYVTVRGKRQDAGRELARLLNEAHNGTLIEPSKVTVAQYIRNWLNSAQGLSPQDR